MNILYLSRKGGRGLASIQNCVDASMQRFKYYINKRGGRLIIAIRHNTDNTSINLNNQKTKMGRKITLWILQATNRRHHTRENLHMALKGKA